MADDLLDSFNDRWDLALVLEFILSNAYFDVSYEPNEFFLG